MHVATTLPPQPIGLGCPMPPPDAGDPLPPALAACAAGAHAIVYGRHALEALCGLLRAGAASVTLLREGERPACGSADLLIATRVDGAEQAAVVANHACRALCPGGIVRIGLGAAPPAAVLHALHQALQRYGFALSVLTVDADGQALVATRAGLPA